MLRILPQYADDVLSLYERPPVGWQHLPERGRRKLHGLVYLITGMQESLLQERYFMRGNSLVRDVQYNQRDEYGVQLWGADAYDAIYELASSKDSDDGRNLAVQARFDIQRVGDIRAVDEAVFGVVKTGAHRRMVMTLTVEYVKSIERVFPQGEGYIEHVTLLPETESERNTISVSKGA